jgi:transketolase
VIGRAALENAPDGWRTLPTTRRGAGLRPQVVERGRGDEAGAQSMVMARHDHAGRPTTSTLARDVRRLVIEHSYRAHVGHIGSSLSIADILAALYGSVLHGAPGDVDRDRFVLSKGHAALALFSVLALTDRLDPAQLETFGIAGSPLGVHPEPGVPGIDFGTGSLGQGLAVGAGAALGARMQGRDARTFVLLSDGELNEGAVWESVQFAAHHGLRNLVAVVDVNGQQAFGATAEVIAIPDLGGAFTAFGWETVRVDGHDPVALADALDVTGTRGAPRVVLAETEFGHGVSFMARQLKWHYLPLDQAQYEQALEEIDRQ